MNFDLSDDQLAFEETARQFAMQEFAPMQLNGTETITFPLRPLKSG